MSLPASLRPLVGELARDLGAARADHPDSWRLQRCAEHVETLLIHATPTAAELVRDGMPVDEAVEWAEDTGASQRRLLRLDRDVLSRKCGPAPEPEPAEDKAVTDFLDRVSRAA